MKKLTLIATVVLMLAITATSVYAGCHGSSSRSKSVRYSVCNIESCDLDGLHTHNKRTYTGHYYGDGHLHDYCAIEDCVIEGYHEHDGVYCFAHDYYDGHDYHDELCYVRGCALTGYHEHNGNYCFSRSYYGGYHHGMIRIY